MNKAQEILNRVKQMFDSIETPAAPVAPVQLSTAKLSDGTEVSYDKLEVGGVVTAAGVALGAGDYTFEDGTTVTVGEGGAISAVKPVEEMATPEVTPAAPVIPAPIQVAPTPAPVAAPIAASQFDEVFAGYEKRFAEIEERITVITGENVRLKDQIAKYQETTKQMFALVEEIAGTPSVEPPVQKKRFSAFSNEEVKNKSLNKYAAAMQKIREEAA